MVVYQSILFLFSLEWRVLEYKWVALTVTTIGILMVRIDARIVVVGLPQVASQLHADFEQAIWITQAYTLANTVVLLLIGRLGDIFGRVRIYTFGFGLFTVGSALFTLFVNLGLTVSLNFAILVMSLTAPYDVITSVVSAVNPLSIPAADKLLFVQSLRNAYIAFGIVNALAIVASILQIRRKSQGEMAEVGKIEEVIG